MSNYWRLVIEVVEVVKTKHIIARVKSTQGKNKENNLFYVILRKRH